MRPPAVAWLDGLEDGGRLLPILMMDEDFPSTRKSAFDSSRMTRTGLYVSMRRPVSTFEARDRTN